MVQQHFTSAVKWPDLLQIFDQLRESKNFWLDKSRTSFCIMVGGTANCLYLHAHHARFVQSSVWLMTIHERLYVWTSNFPYVNIDRKTRRKDVVTMRSMVQLDIVVLYTVGELSWC